MRGWSSLIFSKRCARLRKVNGNTYAEDYAATSSLTRLAEEHNVAILILHHSNKSNPADFRDSASGAMSLIGGADNFWSLSRQPMSEDDAQSHRPRYSPRVRPRHAV